jgi:hypothetical protein
VLQSDAILPLGLILGGRREVPLREAPPSSRHCIFYREPAAFLLSYGHIPPGSILLVRSLFDAGGKSVSALQSFIFEEEIHSLWSHVGIVDTEHRVWDIMPGLMVRQLSFAQFLDGVDLLAVRSLESALFDDGRLQAHIEDQAQSQYPSFAQTDVIAAFIRMMARSDVLPIRFQHDELICSTFVDRILRLVSNTEILPDDRPPLVLPGHFARSTAFRDVPMADRIYRIA